MMKRSRAFVLVELLTTMLLQAGFILVMCVSFYMLASFYTKTQQLLTAKDHADRVILFFEDKIIHAGLGLWRCANSGVVRARFDKFNEIRSKTANNAKYILPIAVRTRQNQDEDTGSTYRPDSVANGGVYAGNMLVFLYAERDISSGSGGTNLIISADTEWSNKDAQTIINTFQLIDTDPDNNLNNSDFDRDNTNNTNIKRYAVMETAGVPIYLENIDTTNHRITCKVFGTSAYKPEKNIALTGELMYLKCMRLFTRGNLNKNQERQFAFRELKTDGTGWENTYNQEEGVLEIHMELDTNTNIFTLWVMGTGGVDYTINTSRPATWPEDAHPTPSEWNSDDSDNLYRLYKHSVVYVSRASWKLNNIPAGFDWTK